MNDGVFVTGTDTGVGKTFVSAGILAGLKARGVDAVPMKPVQTGCVRAAQELRAPDVEFCFAAAGLAQAGLDENLVVPYKFEPACSPHLAAELAGTEISLEKIAASFDGLSAKHEFVVVEGAGGVMVPLTRGVLMTALIQKLGLPVLLVARAGLGTINHTLLSLSELRRAGLDVAGVFLNHAEDNTPGYIESDNLRVVQELGCMENVWSVPFVHGSCSSEVPHGFAAHFSACINALK